MVNEGLPLGELRTLSGLVEAVFLALHHPGIPGEEPCGLQLGPELVDVESRQRPGNAVAQRTGLACHAAARHRGIDVELSDRVRDLEGFFAESSRVLRPKYSSMALPLMVISPLPGESQTLAVAFLRRPVA
jgi:hypothetical protein